MFDYRRKVTKQDMIILLAWIACIVLTVWLQGCTLTPMKRTNRTLAAMDRAALFAADEDELRTVRTRTHPDPLAESMMADARRIVEGD